MTLDEAIKIADAALTHDWKTLTTEQRNAFSIVLDAANDWQAHGIAPLPKPEHEWRGIDGTCECGAPYDPEIGGYTCARP